MKSDGEQQDKGNGWPSNRDDGRSTDLITRVGAKDTKSTETLDWRRKKMTVNFRAWAQALLHAHISSSLSSWLFPWQSVARACGQTCVRHVSLLRWVYVKITQDRLPHLCGGVLSVKQTYSSQVFDCNTDDLQQSEIITMQLELVGSVTLLASILNHQISVDEGKEDTLQY